MHCSDNFFCPPGNLPYVVREGDTLYKIAESYSSDVEAILQANVNLNPYNLNVGMRLCIPMPKEEYPSCRTTNYYIAQEGDTFYSIADYFGVDLEELMSSNMGVPPENIFTGIILCIPVAPSPVCIQINSSGSQITVINRKTGDKKTFKSTLSPSSILTPRQYTVTKKRLEAGSIEGAKEIIFSPFEMAIRGEAKMEGSPQISLETDNRSMVEIFNLCPVGTQMEVIL